MSFSDVVHHQIQILNRAFQTLQLLSEVISSLR